MPGFTRPGAQRQRDRRVSDDRQGHRRGGCRGGIAKTPSWLKYRNEGYILFRDPEGYPPLTPPWGTLNAIDLNKGEIRWQIPFGEYPELVAKGIKDTGSDNYGGPVVTASGLLFIGATSFDKKFRAFDKLTGKLLWETVLPAAGNATPSVYENRRAGVRRDCLRRRQERRAFGRQHRGVRAAVRRTGATIRGYGHRN